MCTGALSANSEGTSVPSREEEAASVCRRTMSKQLGTERPGPAEAVTAAASAAAAGAAAAAAAEALLAESAAAAGE